MTRLRNLVTSTARFGKFIVATVSFAWLSFFYFLMPGGALGQQTSKIPAACERTMRNIATKGFLPTDLSHIDRSTLCFWEVFASDAEQVRRALQAQSGIQKSAATIQSGAPSSANGTTSAISKPLTPMALATEYGGISSSTNNQTVTLQTTLDAIPKGIVGRGDQLFCWSPTVTIPGCIKFSTLQHLNRIGLGITANTTSAMQNISGTAAAPQGTSQQASLKTGGSSAPSFSSGFIKFTIIRGTYQIPDGSDQSLLPKTDLNAAAQKIIAKLAAAPPAISQTPNGNYKKWQTDCIEARFTQAKLASMSNDDVNNLFARYYVQIGAILFNGAIPDCSDSAPVAANITGFPKNLAPTDWRKELTDAIDEYIAGVSFFEAQLLNASSTPAVSLEYDYNTPVNQPTTSTVKLIGSKVFGDPICNKKKKDTPANTVGSQNTSNTKRFTGTVNVGGNFYNSDPGVPGAGRFRDLQAGVEMDAAFCTSTARFIGSFLGNSTVGLTYYYQDQVSPSILKVTPGMPLPGISIIGLSSSTSSVFATKGPINFLQLKYGLGTGKNVKFPIAVSWSNRTDLVTHSLWSAQFGVSYDFSSLLNSTNSSSGSAGTSQ